jgi:hypothetical protein
LNGCLAADTGLKLSAKQTTNLDHSDLSTMKGGRQSLTRKKHKQQMLSMRFIVVTFCLSPLLVQGLAVVADMVGVLRNCASQFCFVSAVHRCRANGAHRTIRVAHADASRASRNARHSSLHYARMKQARFTRKNKRFTNIVLEHDCKRKAYRACAFDEKKT